MPDVGVRELKIRASEIVRRVRDQRVQYVVTYRGRPVGLLTPLDEGVLSPQQPGGEAALAAWETLIRLGEEIGQGWRSPLSSTELLSEMRR
ncbi:MAG: type II toxin-antitoxin system prevent-host-death family antitoxin [Anaerolineae bacterium]|nr:type II toxin-antitoxin system prevent-host-death family antitoxin [Anaerolineae bacterium]